MKYSIINTLLFVFLSCNGKQKGSQPIVDKKAEPSSLHARENGFEGLWQQYKKKGAFPNDTIPNLNCLIRISRDTFYYIINEKVQYKDLLIRDSSYQYPVYGFKNNYQDKLHVLAADFSEIQLKKFADEGDYEYFKKVNN